MEALSVGVLPTGPEWQYEPKWDGFRCLLFRDGDKVVLQSKSGQDLTRYFPEVVAMAHALPVARVVLDGELVIREGDGLSFDALLQRIHPAASRVKRLAAETPATFIVFDLLGTPDGRSLLAEPLRKRRPALTAFARTAFKTRTDILLSPATTEAGEAKAWLAGAGAALDGIIAKRLDLPYEAGERGAMQKIKTARSADCVVGGFRYGAGSRDAASLLLGLYDADGLLHHVGFSSSFARAERPALTRKLEALIAPPGFSGRAPGGPSRWASARSAEWQPLKPTLVVEVSFDHMTGGRFRHGTRLLRWRPDKAPRQCTFEQLGQTAADVSLLLGP